MRSKTWHNARSARRSLESRSYSTACTSIASRVWPVLHSRVVAWSKRRATSITTSWCRRRHRRPRRLLVTRLINCHRPRLLSFRPRLPLLPPRPPRLFPRLLIWSFRARNANRILLYDPIFLFSNIFYLIKWFPNRIKYFRTQVKYKN